MLDLNKTGSFKLAVLAALLAGTGCGDDPTAPSRGETALTTPAMAQADHRDRQSFVLEFDGGDFTPGATTLGSTLGWSQLKRDPNDLKAIVHAHGLKPGGVFTFWWVVVQDDATSPTTSSSLWEPAP